MTINTERKKERKERKERKESKERKDLNFKELLMILNLWNIFVKVDLIFMCLWRS